MKRIRSRNTTKIIDLLAELKVSPEKLQRVLRELRIPVSEGQNNLDQNEVGKIRQFLNEQKRREELKRQTIAIPSIIKVQDLAKALRLPIGDVLAALLKNGVIANLNHDLDYDTASIIASDLGYTIQENVAALEQDVLTPEKLSEILKKEDAANLQTRPPIVTILGHVDHGKTTLLDTIRSSNIASQEVGGITQAISSYQAEYKGRKITFIDTPGHATFQFMRQRGASLADIAILVVAADDGVQPQTKEAAALAQGAKVALIVALNKVDKSQANIDKVKRELADIGLMAEDWGGKTVTVPISALKKEGIDKLLEMIVLTADLLELKANPNRLALGTVIESSLDPHQGPQAVVLLHAGTLKTGDHVVVGNASGRIRQILDFRGKSIAEGTPSMPVTLVGLEEVPHAGDILQAVERRSEARQKAVQRRAPVKSLNNTSDSDSRPHLSLVIKADSKGSLEAIEHTIKAMVPPSINLTVIRSEVGTVSDSDVLTAQAAGAIVYAFNTTIGGMTKKLAEKEKVPVKTYRIIYQLADDVRQALDERLPFKIVRKDLGRLKVLKVFFSTQKKKIIGTDVVEGELVPDASITVWRRESGGAPEEVAKGKILEIQKEKRVVERAEKGDQVGLTIEGKGKIKEGDVIEVFKEEKIKQTE
jgi:translation initiation factor IF-2